MKIKKKDVTATRYNIQGLTYEQIDMLDTLIGLGRDVAVEKARGQGLNLDHTGDELQAFCGDLRNLTQAVLGGEYE